MVVKKSWIGGDMMVVNVQDRSRAYKTIFRQSTFSFLTMSSDKVKVLIVCLGMLQVLFTLILNDYHSQAIYVAPRWVKR